MEHSRYGLSVTLPLAFDTAVADTTAALKAEGFGVLTSIDVQQTLKTKLNRDFRKYVTLGACNPVLADRALHAELEIGLLLPCNVIIYETAREQSVVAAMAPRTVRGCGLLAGRRKPDAVRWGRWHSSCSPYTGTSVDLREEQQQENPGGCDGKRRYRSEEGRHDFRRT